MGENVQVDVNAVFPDNLSVSISKTTKDFIAECAMRLYSAINFDETKYSPDKIAKLSVYRANMLAQELISAGILK